MNAIKFLKLAWKTGATALAVVSIAFAGLFLTLNSAHAGSPNTTLLYLGNNNNDPSDSWDHDVTLNAGQMVQLQAEVHNTNVPSTANNVKIKVTLPQSSGTSTATVSSDNSNTVSDNVSITVAGGGQLKYVAGSTEVNCGQNTQCTSGTVSDGIVGNGIVLGNQDGCNEYVIQVSFLVEVVDAPTYPTPTTGGDINVNQTQTQTNNQNVTVNSSAAPAVLAAKVPVKAPETGVGVLGMAAMFGAAPLGLVLSRYGRGRVIISKKDEELSANELVQTRVSKKA